MDVFRNILLVEDDPEYALLVQLAVQEAAVSKELHVVSDGAEAMRYLSGEGQYADRLGFPQPDVVLMDLRMPKVGGFELLRWVRGQPQLRGVRISILTGSAIGDEPRLALELGADCYSVKPFQFRDLVRIMRDLRNACARDLESLRRAA